MKMRKKKHLQRNPSDVVWAKLWNGPPYNSPLQPLSQEKLSRILDGFVEALRNNSSSHAKSVLLHSEEDLIKMFGGAYDK